MGKHSANLAKTRKKTFAKAKENLQSNKPKKRRLRVDNWKPGDKRLTKKQRRLAEENIDWARECLHEHHSALRKMLGPEEFEQQAWFIAIEAAWEYQAEKGTMRTLIGHVAYWKGVSLLSRYKKGDREVDFTSIMGKDAEDSVEERLNLVSREVNRIEYDRYCLKMANQMVDGLALYKDRDIMRFHYGLKEKPQLTAEQIAKRLKMKPDQVNYVIRRSLERMRRRAQLGGWKWDGPPDSGPKIGPRGRFNGGGNTKG